MNEISILNALYDGTVVKCKFLEGFNGSEQPTKKTYSYKCAIPDIAVGDKVVVDAAGTFKVVEVVEVSDALELQPDVSYKWVVQKVDTAKYMALLDADNKAIRELRVHKRRAVAAQITSQFGLSEVLALEIQGKNL